MKQFSLTYNNRPLLKTGYNYYPSENLGPINTWTIPSTTTDVVSYSSEDTIKLNGKGGHYEICYKAFSVEKTGTYTISYDYNLPTVNFYGTDSNHMYFGIFITTNQPPGGDMPTWSAYSTGNCNGYVICGPSSQNNRPGEGHAEFNYNLTAGTTYYLWVPMMNLADGVLTYLTFTNLKWTDTEPVVIPDYKARTYVYDLNIPPQEHGTCVANKYLGFTDNLVSVTATPDDGWYHIGYNITGSEMTGNDFKFLNNDVNLEPVFSETEGYPITYETTEGGSLDGDPVFIPGSTGVTLNSVYDTYYRLSGYDVTGGTITDGVLVADGPCTAKAVYKVNYFTATGNFEKGSNVNCRGNDVGGKAWRYLNVPENYALYQNHTGDIPSSWYETSNRWKPNDVSSYSITLNTKMTFTANNGYATAKCTAVSMIGETQTASQTYTESYVTNVKPTTKTWTYNKTVTTTVQNVNYGVSAKLAAYHFQNKKVHDYATATYIATGTTGTWTATGIAP